MLLPFFLTHNLLNIVGGAMVSSFYHRELYETGDISESNLVGSKIPTLITCASICGGYSNCQRFKFIKDAGECYFVKLNPGAISVNLGTEIVYSYKDSGGGLLEKCPDVLPNWPSRSPEGHKMLYQESTGVFSHQKQVCEDATLNMAMFSIHSEITQSKLLIRDGAVGHAFVGIHNPTLAACTDAAECSTVLRWYKNGDATDEPIGLVAAGFFSGFTINAGLQFVILNDAKSLEAVDGTYQSGIICMCHQ